MTSSLRPLEVKTAKGAKSAKALSIARQLCCRRGMRILGRSWRVCQFSSLYLLAVLANLAVPLFCLSHFMSARCRLGENSVFLRRRQVSAEGVKLFAPPRSENRQVRQERQGSLDCAPIVLQAKHADSGQKMARVSSRLCTSWRSWRTWRFLSLA